MSDKKRDTYDGRPRISEVTIEEIPVGADLAEGEKTKPLYPAK